jgi:C4-dicarboxylate-specific signal transduction histidine kinase
VNEGYSRRQPAIEGPTTPASPARVSEPAGRVLTSEDLAYLNRMTTVGQVLPNVAHEINNALQVVGGLVEMLSLKPELAPDVRDKIARIGVQAGRTAEMLRELVAFARREYGGVRHVGVNRLIDRALALRRYHLARARIVVEVTGAPPDTIVVRADAHHLEQVLVNLVMNAEASLAGRHDGRIEIAVRDEGPRVSVTVTDNGHGMVPAVAGAATAPFFTTRDGAAGLGLTVARLLVEADGGVLTVAALEGGTSVTIVLPAATPSAG